jgi:hypothetical protein
MDFHRHRATINWRCLLVLAAVKKIELVAMPTADHDVFKNASSRRAEQRHFMCDEAFFYSSLKSLKSCWQKTPVVSHHDPPADVCEQYVYLKKVTLLAGIR